MKNKLSLLVLILIMFTNNMQARRMRPMTPLDGEWVITKIANPTKLTTVANTNGVLTINDYNKIVNATVGCNSINGNYTNKASNDMKMGVLAITKMACEGEVDKLENNLVRVLQKVTNYKLNKEGTQLFLFNKKIKILELTKKGKMVENTYIEKPMPSLKRKLPEEKYILKAQLDNNTMVKVGTPKTSFIIDKNRNRFSANVGCNTINGRWEPTSKNELAPFNCVSTEMTCPDMVDGMEEKFKENLNLINMFEKTATGLKLFHDKQLLIEMESKL